MIPVRQDQLLSRRRWEKHEAHFLAVFLRALQLLREEASLPAEEIALNRMLYSCLLRAIRERDPDALYPPVMSECCNQPDPDDNARAKREDKRPDFTWGFIDPHEDDPLRSAKQFVIECKRLGCPHSDWVFTQNYVEHGIWRFIDTSWGYAKRFPSALMIGYWQSMDPNEVLTEVTRWTAARDLAAVALSVDGWQIAAVSKLQHSLTRAFPVSPLRLDHFWIDLRGKCSPSIQKITKPKRRKVARPPRRR